MRRRWCVSGAVSFLSSNPTGRFLNRIAFSTDELPVGFDDRARLSEWRDFLRDVLGSFEVSRLSDRPFSQCLEAAQFGSTLLARFSGTTDRMSTSSSSAATMPPDYFLCLRS